MCLRFRYIPSFLHTNRHILSGASKLQVGQVLLTYLQVSCRNLDMRCASDFVIYHHFLKKINTYCLSQSMEASRVAFLDQLSPQMQSMGYRSQQSPVSAVCTKITTSLSLIIVPASANAL